MQASCVKTGSKLNLRQLKEIVYFRSYQVECEIETRVEISD